MKILQVTNKVPYPTKDGGAIACMNLTKGFSHLGHQVTVLAMNTVKHHVHLEEIPENIRELARFKLVDVPARITVLGALFNFIFSRSPYNAVRFIDDKFAKELKKILREEDYDVVQLEGLYVCPYIPLIRKNSNALIVYRAHNVEYEIWERAADMAKGWVRFYLRNLSSRIKRFETRWLNTYDVLVPITDRDDELLRQMGNIKPSHVSQTGIDSSALIPNARHLEHPSLFHIGSMEWAPNQEGLVWFVENCWPLILEKYPDLHFYIAGRNAPQWLIKKLDKPNIEFLGEVDDAYKFMNSKSIMVVPLFSGSGMRVKIIEGMALGKCVVSTPIGAEGIEVTNGKNILLASKPDEFVREIGRLIEDPELFREVGGNAIGFIHEKFDNLKTSAKLVDFYNEYIR